jgi:uncharacterized secreted protein with C-terminal beta-propeller domain
MQGLKPMLLLAAFGLAACGGSSSPGIAPAPAEQPPGLLSPVGDDAAFELSIKQGLARMTGSDVLESAGTADQAGFTGTYTQELGVDEADTVRYDGEHLIVAPRRYFSCCFVFDNAFASPLQPPPSAIRILKTDPDNGTAELVGEIGLAEGTSVQGLYQTADTLFALTAQRFYGSYGGLWADIAIWAPETLGLEVHDLADPAEPELSFQAEIDGVFVDSRRIGNTVYVVTRHTPQVDGLHYYVTTPQQQSENESLLASTSLDDLLPKITIAGETRLLVEPENCFVTTSDDTDNNPVLTSITAVPIDDPENFSTVCYSESAYGIYVSEVAFYLAELRQDTALQRDITRIHKFALDGTSIRYAGSADIEGVVWRGNQTDFRLSEHDGNLRVLASRFDWASDDFVDHYLYVLRESADSPDLDILATLPNDTRPQEIGQPNEALYGVRFLGDRAYAVTFEQIDPLYVIDLSDPAEPVIAGELHVPGFSDFLHPVTAELLLGLGRDATGGIKLELYDASSITQPVSRGTQVIGGRGSYSEAISNRHAFTYQTDVGGVDRFTVPIHAYAADGSSSYLGASLYLFEIRDKSTPQQAALIPVGSVTPPAAYSVNTWIGRSRAFLHDEAIFYVRDEQVWASFWYAPAVVNGPF